MGHAEERAQLKQTVSVSNQQRVWKHIGLSFKQNGLFKLLLRRAFAVWLGKFRKSGLLSRRFIDLLCAFYCAAALWFLWDTYGVPQIQLI